MTALVPGQAGELAEMRRRELAGRLLAQGVDRFQWGWQFVPAERPVPDLLGRPVLPPEQFGGAASAAALGATAKACTIGGVVLGGALGALGAATGASLAVPALATAGVAVAGGGLTSMYARWREAVGREREGAWMDAHDQQRQGSSAAAESQDEWRPVQGPPDVTRVDVVCGTWDGWAAMIATTAGSLMRSDRSVVVLDLTSHEVAEDLIQLVSSTGRPVPCGRFPTDLSLVDLFHDLSPEAVGRVIADAFAVLPGRSGAAEIRRRDEAIVRTVARLIDPPWTFRRLAAGVRLLQRLSETSAGSGQAGGVLSLREQRALMQVSHEFGRTPQESAELTYLVDSFERLAGNDDRRHADRAAPDYVSPDHAPPDYAAPEDAAPEDAAPEDAVPAGGAPGGAGEPVARPGSGLWRPGLTVLAAPVYNKDHGESARILLYRFMEDLRHGAPHRSDDLIVVAGVDRLGRDVLDEFSQHARNARVRTMFLHQHVPARDDAQRMLNTAGSVTLLMRTHNALEAQAAVELVGSEYRFVLSQETQSTSESLGWSRDETKGTGTSTSEDSQRGWSIQVGMRRGERLPVFNRSRSGSRGTARTVQWSRSRGRSGSSEKGTSAAMSRVFEPAVEPVEVETLPETAFIVLNKVHFRQPVLGDCDPGLCQHPLATVALGKPPGQARTPAGRTPAGRTPAGRILNEG
ncbi:hypothetical protein UG55_1008129 [Frankia sp. EI5c]|uniref:hypothetical protein n=1 Tax=Frankia sp. EI5c TaxID=683316 RepID=UPI0007C257F2|nr:hypothetical protein [Frankia sp. EI5c]OAA27478.1 hypothetical protein UG55_1008129 [Frankia sp. EI5c]